jgi:hypothetical protein
VLSKTCRGDSDASWAGGIMKTFKVTMVSILLAILIVGIALCGMANAKHYSYSGYREDTGQRAAISFDLDKETGSITNGAFHLDKVCEQGVHFVGADMTFAGTVSSISLEGKSNTCEGKHPEDCGHGKMWYDKSFGVVMQWKSDCQYGVETNFIFKTSTNPF